jgi:hypothetical protein
LLVGLLRPVLILLVLQIPWSHGNYFTAIMRRSGTKDCQLIVFALRMNETDAGSGFDCG